jgi:hypothetical protein
MKRLRSDNLLLAPASELPFKDEWHRLAHSLPAGSMLFVVPADETPMKHRMREIAATLRHQGRRIAAVPSKTSG